MLLLEEAVRVAACSPPSALNVRAAVGRITMVAEPLVNDTAEAMLTRPETVSALGSGRGA
jgi:hypothetical protein